MFELCEKKGVQIMKQDKRNFCLSIAGHSFFIHSLYTETYEMCREYLCHEVYDKAIQEVQNKEFMK